MQTLNLFQGPPPTNCSECGLVSAEMRKRIWGHGSLDSGIVVVGEYPGNEDLAKRIPFSGFSGQLLKRVLQGANIDPSGVYFTNVSLCQPPAGRQPSTHEISCCARRLELEILACKPKRILALGSAATQALVGKPIHKCQGRYHYWKGIPLMPAYHPAFVVRPGSEEMFRDLCFAVEKLNKEPGNYYPLEDDGYPSVPYTILTKESFYWLRELRNGTDGYKQHPMTVDVEFARDGRLLAVGFCFAPQHTYIIPGELFSGDKSVRDAFQLLLNWYSIGSQNGSTEYEVLREHGIDFPIDFDTMLAHHALDERSGDDDTGGKGGSYHGLGTIAALYLDAPDWKGLMASYKDDYGLAPLDVLYRYLALDCSTEHRLRDTFELLLVEEGLDSMVKQYVFPMVQPITRMQITGIKVDLEYMKGLEKSWEADIERQTEEYKQLVNRPTLNLRSPKQVADLLFNQLKFPNIGKGSTDKHVIAKLQNKFPDRKEIQAIADIRSHHTILSTFIKGIPKLVNPKTGRVHTRFLLHGTPTQRLASRDPNLQNIPARIGAAIRDAFVAIEGWNLCNVDYKQLEFRVWAFLSGDKNLIKFILDERDIHSEVAAAFFNIIPGTETKSQRLDAKTFVFRIPYGGGPEGVAQDFNLPIEEARRRHGALKAMFPDGFKWIDEVQEKCLADGYVANYIGHKRRFPLVLAHNQQEIRRQAGNSPIQGLAAIICREAIRRVMTHPNWNDAEIEGQIQVHDSFVFSIREDCMHHLPWIVREMEADPWPTTVPFLVDVEVGKRWGSLEKVDKKALLSN